MTKWALVLMASTALLPPAAYAQEAVGGKASETSAEKSNDIIVTAQRYEQRLQDVPLSVSVVGSKELAARGLTDLKDLQYSVPGFSSFEYGVSRQYVQLRGVANTIGSSTIGTYFDETPISSDVQGDAVPVRLLDMERIEVLRGPQATLYGQGSMGGTIRYIPAVPKLDAVGGSADGEWSFTKGGADNYKAVGVLNLPFNEKIGIRIVGGYERIGGYIDNVVSGEKNVNQADIYTVRGSLLAKPSDRLSLSLIGLYQKSNQANQDFGVNYKTNAEAAQPANDRYTLVQGKAGYDLDFAELSASASYLDRRNFSVFDNSRFYLQALGMPPGIDQITTEAVTKYKMYHGEFRLASQADGPFHWQIGATYRDLRTHSVGGAETAPGTLPYTLSRSDSDLRTKSYAFYGEVGYDFTSQLKAIVGVRYFNERKRQIVDSIYFNQATFDDHKATFDSVNPRFNLSYAFTPDSMVFVNVAKGFRGGGFNLTSVGGGVVEIPPSYEPDEIWTYELGTKHQLFGNKLVLDASVYRSIWSKVQSYIIVPGSELVAVNNSGDVKGWGVDLSATVRPTSTLTLTGTYGWNNLEFKKATIDKLPGDPIDGAVRESWSASLDFRPPLSEGITGIFRIDYQHADRSQLTFRNFLINPIVRRPGRDIVNLRVGAAFGPVEVALFANNLFDENAPNIVGPFGVISENVEQRPRVIGISASTRF